jgi:hypothetical protein
MGRATSFPSRVKGKPDVKFFKKSPAGEEK